MGYDIKGAKLVEIPFLKTNMSGRSMSDEILIVGEQVGAEGIIQTVLETGFSKIICTDIMASISGSELDMLMQQHPHVEFVQSDFVEYSEEKTFQYIACINVLEHFGMNYAEFHGFSGILAGNDYIRWNHDLRGINKMIKLLNKNPRAKIIITVPCGPPILGGDLNHSNKMPMLRRYDDTRINLIKQMISETNMQLHEKFYITEDFTTWYETDSSISTQQFFQMQNPYTPNAIWAFTISHI